MGFRRHLSYRHFAEFPRAVGVRALSSTRPLENLLKRGDQGRPTGAS